MIHAHANLGLTHRYAWWFGASGFASSAVKLSSTLHTQASHELLLAAMGTKGLS